MDVLYGVHAVEEALRSRPGAISAILVARERSDARVTKLAETARKARVAVRTESREALSRLAQSEQHQGVVAMAKPKASLTLEDLLADISDGPDNKESTAFVLALDGVEDPHNLGALLRTADAAGVTGVVLPERRSAPVNATVAKTSAGASEHVRIARVPNLNRALEQLKQAGVWCVGLDERGGQDYDAYDYRGPFCLVLGREGEGLHEQTRKHCDVLLRIPMAGAVPSLNVSVAGAVVMYEAARQRRAAARPAVDQVAAKPPKPKRGLGSE